MSPNADAAFPLDPLTLWVLHSVVNFLICGQVALNSVNFASSLLALFTIHFYLYFNRNFSNWPKFSHLGNFPIRVNFPFGSSFHLGRLPPRSPLFLGQIVCVIFIKGKAGKLWQVYCKAHGKLATKGLVTTLCSIGARDACGSRWNIFGWSDANHPNLLHRC